MLKTSDIFTLENSLATDLLASTEYPWEALSKISDYILKLGATLSLDDFEQVEENIWIHRTAKVAPTACLNGPLIIDAESEVRHCAFIRGNALIGKKCVVGNSTEIKNSILIYHCEVPHYNYIGDSILGPYAHLGAGVITSNIKSDRKNIVVKTKEQHFETGLRKFGAMIGDRVEVGCNSVLNPGSVIGKNSRIYPLSMVRGFVPADSVYKCQNDICDLEN